MIVPISKIQIIGPLELFAEVIDFLKIRRIIHPEREIESFCGDLKVFLKNYSSSEEIVREKIFYESLKRRVESFLEISRDITLMEREGLNIEDINVNYEEIEKDTNFLKNYIKKIEELEKKKEEIELYIKFLSLAKSSFEDVLDLTSLEITGLLLKNEENAERLRKILEEKGRGLYKVITKKDEKNNVISIIIYPKEVKEELKRYLKDINIPEIATPSEVTKVPLSQKIELMDDKLKKIDEQRELLIKEKNDKFSEKKALYLENLKIIKRRLEQIEDRVFLFKSERLFYIFGWVPRERLINVVKEIKKEFKEVVLIEEIPLYENEIERVPVIIKNSAYFEPFEVLTKIFPLPSYGSYDPTLFLGIFFPLFFGIIVGDMGYGIVISILAIIGSKYFKKDFLRSISKVLFYGGVGAIIFGVVYGEFFGELGEEIYFLERLKLFDRKHSIMQMFLIALFIGISHIVIGFILAIIKPSHKKERGLSLSILISLAIISIIIFLLFLGGDNKILYALTVLGIIIFALSITFFGIIFPLELIKTLGNIVSYGRIMAIGLSSVILANIANNFMGAIGNIFVGFLIALLIHSINIVLSVFSPTIHSLRLHYVEFFSKFMKFGGKKFNPL